MSGQKVYVIGHKHPDTDSVCSAIAYAWLKNQLGDAEYEPRRAGSYNRETEFVLNRFGVDAPRLCTDFSPQIKDISIQTSEGIDPEMSLRDAWNRMRRDEIDTLCITGKDNELIGLIAVKDIANTNMDLLDTGILSAAKTPYRNVLGTLNAEMLSGDPDGVIAVGQIGVGTSPELMEQGVREGDILLVSDRYEAQSCAIECGAACIIVCCGAKVSRTVLARAKEKNCVILSTPYNTYAAARLINTATPVRHLMQTRNLTTFGIHTPLDEVRKVMSQQRFRNFPVLDEGGKYCGMVSHRSLLNPERKKVILVDHNERAQAVDGLEQAEILEIIDHHRLGNLETNGPISFRNVPVGSTSTILYQIFQEQQITPSASIAGLMLSAILSDTLKFRSPTSTAADRAAAESLAQLAGVEIDPYAKEMFEAAGNLQGRTAEEVFFSDFKLFSFDNHSFGVGQACFMSTSLCSEAETLLKDYLPQALTKVDVPIVLYMITDMTQQHTALLYAGKDSQELVRQAFDAAADNGRAELRGVVSRKKQLIPALRAALQN